MPRELSSERCEVTFYDRISDSNITIYYDMPTTEDRVKYSNSLVTRRMNKIESTIGNARVNAGFKLIKGFKEGAFSVPGKGVISSDQSSSQYDPNWKTAIKTYAADILESLAIHVFEATLNTVDANAEDQSESDGESEGNPS